MSTTQKEKATAGIRPKSPYFSISGLSVWSDDTSTRGFESFFFLMPLVRQLLKFIKLRPIRCRHSLRKCCNLRLCVYLCLKYDLDLLLCYTMLTSLGLANSASSSKSSCLYTLSAFSFGCKKHFYRNSFKEKMKRKKKKKKKRARVSKDMLQQ